MPLRSGGCEGSPNDQTLAPSMTTERKHRRATSTLPQVKPAPLPPPRFLLETATDPVQGQGSGINRTPSTCRSTSRDWGRLPRGEVGSIEESTKPHLPPGVELFHLAALDGRARRCYQQGFKPDPSPEKKQVQVQGVVDDDLHLDRERRVAYGSGG